MVIYYKYGLKRPKVQSKGFWAYLVETLAFVLNSFSWTYFTNSNFDIFIIFIKGINHKINRKRESVIVDERFKICLEVLAHISLLRAKVDHIDIVTRIRIKTFYIITIIQDGKNSIY